MKRILNECCGCAVPAYPCLGDSCPNRRVPHYYCDRCEAEETLYKFEDEELCADCLLAEFSIVKGSEV